MGNPFNFAGGDILTNMGASWFVSYKYYETIDNCHENWRRVNTWQNRISVFVSSRGFHKFWLNMMLGMNDRKLNTNAIDLKAREIKQMASRILFMMS